METANFKYAVGDKLKTPGGKNATILDIEPSGYSEFPFNYKMRIGREVWRIATTTVDEYPMKYTVEGTPFST
jgi:hypothetical protein